MKPAISVLFVCLGNICRSPSAEAVLKARASAAGLDIFVDSAGTGNWHVGQTPDERAIAAAAARGLDMRSLHARQVSAADFLRFTHILAMDHSNLEDLRAMCPPGGTSPTLFLQAASLSTREDVPDPYYGGPQGFERMLDLIENAVDGLLYHLAKDHDLNCGGRS